MNILALDLATQTGYAAQLGQATVSGTKSFKPLSSQSVGALFAKWEKWINYELDGKAIEFLAYELINFELQTRAWRQIYFGMTGIMFAAAHRRNIGTRGFTVLDVKLVATGKARADKPDMIASARIQWPHQSIIDDNQADALWVLFLACKSQGQEIKHANELF